MIASTVDVKCPKCGEETPVPLREIRGKGHLDVTCVRCGADFPLDATEAKATLDNLDKALGKLPPWVKVKRDF